MFVFLFLLVAMGAGLWYGRWYLLVHHPQTYEELHSAEKDFAKAAVAATERAFGSLVAAIKGMARLLTSRKA
jgi:hypothetical protein